MVPCGFRSNMFSKFLQSISLTGIDAKTAASTKIGTTENGTQRFYPIYLVVTCTAATSISVVPTLSIGTNSSSYNNIVTATSMAGITSANTFLTTFVIAALGSVAASTDIYTNISLGATATAMTIKIDLFGLYS